MAKLLFLVNDASFFLSHRSALALAARDKGYEVVVSTMPGKGVSKIKELGFEYREVSLNRSGRNPFSEAVSFFSVLKLLWKVKPDILHLVTIKPVIYGGIASRLSPVSGVVCAVSGLGFVFMKKGAKALVLKRVIEGLYRLAFGKNNLMVIFQNPDDRDTLLSSGAVTCRKVSMVRGSGVDLELYKYLPEPEATPVVCFAARLLADKGIHEFVAAAELLRKKGLPARFLVAGDIDPGNPTSVSLSQLECWRDEGVVEILGYQSDMAAFLSDVNLVVLPSYREGLPKVLVEAAAAGRAVVTTDVPGCRDAIEPGITGVLVPVKSVLRLAEAIEGLVNDHVLRRKMGRAGRALAERDFCIEKIVQQHLDIYETVGPRFER